MPDRRFTQRRWCVRLTAVIVLFFGSVAACGSQADNPDNPSPAAPQRSKVTVKIMPLGDSITESTRRLNSYRYYLWHVLLDQGYHIDFVGSQYGVGNGPPANPDFDMDHEGHAGWRADEILNHIQTWATAASPDFVLIHIGTNDLSQGQSVASTVNDIRGIIDALRKVNPRIQILLAQLIAKTGVPSIAVLNGNLPALVADKNRAESPIVLVNQYSGLDPSTMTYDGTHPNAIGDSHMADRWFEKLAPMLDAFLTQRGPEAGQGRP
jgi:acyl-CoA thioesterase-1